MTKDRGRKWHAAGALAGHALSRRIPRRLAWLLLVLALLPGLAGQCPPARAGEGPPWTIEDADGRVIVFAAPFTRIVSLYQAHAENLVRLGAARQLRGVSRASRGLPGLEHAAPCSFRDNPERILALKPDLVLIRPMIARARPDLTRRLEEAGVRVVSLQPLSPEAMFAYWLDLGRLCGRLDQARAMVEDFQRQRRAIVERVAHVPRKARPRVYFEAMHRRMKTFAPGAMALYVLESAGGVNVAADAPRVRNTAIAAYGKERILARAGEIEVFLAQRGRMNPVSVEDIVNEPGFQVIRAVRQGRVYLVDEALVSRPTPRLIQGMERIQALLYPGLAPGDGP